jgi:tetratricopeptide (TPR) repeat protein
LKLIYVATIAAGVVVAAATVLLLKPTPLTLLAVAIVLLLPGRIQGHYWRSFFRGRRCMSEKRFEEAITHFNSFLELLGRRPGLRHLIWLQASVYTRSVEVMAYNNIGGAALSLGRLDDADTAFETARLLDPESPLPVYNLALLAHVRGQDDSARELFSTSRALGYPRGSFDQLIHKAGAALAAVEGGGARRRD